MKKLSEYRKRAALDKLADIIDPLGELMGDVDFVRALAKKRRWEAVSVAVKKHPEACLEFLAGVDGVPVEDYDCGVMAFPLRLFEILSDEKLYTGFISPEEENAPLTSSGNATANTEE